MPTTGQQGRAEERMARRAKISIDPDACQGNSQCYMTAPQVFEVVDDLSSVRDEADLEYHRSAIEEAVRRCPTGAITATWAESDEEGAVAKS
jgi:ferredoxin